MPAGNVIHLGSMVRRVQITVILAIAALLANAQCYARCLSALSGQAQAHTACHHSSHSQHDGPSQCGDQHHPETAIAEARADHAKIPALLCAPVTLSLLAALPLNQANHMPSFDGLAERGSPPDKPLFLSISVLRL